MTRLQPEITVLLPWKYSRIAKSVQSQSRKQSSINLGANHQGLRVTATPQDFVNLGLARVSDEYSSPVVARLKEARIPVRVARTLHLPGALSVAELQLGLAPLGTEKLAGHLGRDSGADILILYDKLGQSHSQGPRVAQVQPGRRAPAVGLVGRAGVLARRQAKASQYEDLVQAIRDVWEKSGEDFVQQVDWDNSDYEMFTTQDLVAGTLAEYLKPAQLERWEDLEPEVQTAILDAAFPEDKIKDTAARLERHFWNQSRGASSQAPKTTVEERVDPLDLGIGRQVRLARLNHGGTVQQLFS